MATLPEFDFLCPQANRLAGSGATLHCGQCDRDVHDLSAMTRGEAQRFLDGCRGQSLCIRYQQDVSGRLQFQPDSARPGTRRRPSQLRKVTLALGLGIGGLALGQVALAESGAPQRPGAGGVLVAAHDTLRLSIESALADASRPPVADPVIVDPVAPISQPSDSPEESPDAPTTEAVVETDTKPEADKGQPTVEPPHIMYGGAVAIPVEGVNL